MQEAMEKAAVLVEALPYLQKFNNKEIVIKLGGSVMESEDVLREVLEDVVFLATVGIRPVFVHGGGKHISQELEKRNITTEFVKGYRVTDEKTLNVVIDVLCNKINAKIRNIIADYNCKGICAYKNNHSILRAQKKKLREGEKDVDLGHVGEVTSVNVPELRDMEEEGDIVVIPPIGQDEDGQLYNVNADSAAASVASKLKADKIVFMSNVHGIMARPNDTSSFLSSIKEPEIKELIEQNIIKGGMLPKVDACLKCIGSGVQKAHIIDANLKHSLLLEIFTNAGIGTQIVK